MRKNSLKRKNPPKNLYLKTKAGFGG